MTYTVLVLVYRAATDPADPDLLPTRIQNLSSGSVRSYVLLKLVQNFEHVKFVLGSVAALLV